jgi:cytochrome c oxidase assembly factor CtaG
MVQHLMLIVMVAPIFAVATSLVLAYRAGTPTIRRFLDSRVISAVTHPIVALAIHFVIIPVTRITNFVDLSSGDQGLHHFEHLLFLVVGYLFFRVAFGMKRGVTLHPGLRLVYFMAAVLFVHRPVRRGLAASKPRPQPCGSVNGYFIRRYDATIYPFDEEQ